MNRSAALALLAFAVVAVGANKPMACVGDMTCGEGKCGVLFHSNFTYSNQSMPKYRVAAGCIFNTANGIYWSGIADPFTDLSSHHWQAEENGLTCVYHRHMQSVLCYCETQNCNIVERQREFSRTLRDRGLNACIDTEKRGIVCSGKCFLVLSFVKNEWRIERGCRYDIDEFRHLHGLPLENYGNGYACTPATSGQILCECSGYHCNSKHQLAVALLVDRRKLQKDVETTTERALVTTLSPSEPIRARPTSSDERARIDSESVPSRAHSHILIVFVSALVISLLLAMCFFSQQILQFYCKSKVNSVVKKVLSARTACSM